MENTVQLTHGLKVSIKLFLGILFLPYIFVWFLLKNGYSTLARILGFSWLLLLIVAISTEKPSETSAKSSTQPSITSPPIAQAEPPSISIEYIAKIKAVEQRLNDNREHLKKYYARPDQVRQAQEDSLQLATIRLAYPGNNRPKEELEIKAKAEKLSPRVAEQGRVLYASLMEETLVKTGMDIQIQAKGNESKTLKLVYALMSQPLVYKFQNQIKVNEQAQQYGFTKIIYTNGFDGELGNTWSIDL